MYIHPPQKKIVGELEIEEILCYEKEKLWNMTDKYSGITKEKYDNYYKNQKNAIAYKISKINKYKTPKDLKDSKINSAPQSYIYIRK